MRSVDFFATHPVFTHEEYVAAHGARGDRSPRTANSLLTRYAVAGKIFHVRRGALCGDTCRRNARDVSSRPVPPGDEAGLGRCDRLPRRAAVSRQGLLGLASLRGAHPEPRAAAELPGQRLRRCSPAALARWTAGLGGGVVEEPYAGGTVRVTTFERTLVDVLADPDLGGGWEEVWRSLEMVEYFDLVAVVDHALARGSALTTARVGWFLEQHRDELFVEEQHLKPLRDHAPRQPRYLDGKREAGRLVKSWNLVVPVRVLHRTWAEVA